MRLRRKLFPSSFLPPHSIECAYDGRRVFAANMVIQVLFASRHSAQQTSFTSFLLSPGPRLPAAELDLLRGHHRGRPRRPEPQVHPLRLQGQRQGELSHQGRHTRQSLEYRTCESRRRAKFVLRAQSKRKQTLKALCPSFSLANWWSLMSDLLPFTLCTLLSGMGFVIARAFSCLLQCVQFLRITI